jgi:hypothetical protein
MAKALNAAALDIACFEREAKIMFDSRKKMLADNDPECSSQLYNPFSALGPTNLRVTARLTLYRGPRPESPLAHTWPDENELYQPDVVSPFVRPVRR